MYIIALVRITNETDQIYLFAVERRQPPTLISLILFLSFSSVTMYLYTAYQETRMYSTKKAVLKQPSCFFFVEIFKKSTYHLFLSYCATFPNFHRTKQRSSPIDYSCQAH